MADEKVKTFLVTKREIWEQRVYVNAINAKAANELAGDGQYEVVDDAKYLKDTNSDDWEVQELENGVRA